MRCLLPAVSLFAVALALQEPSNEQAASAHDSASPSPDSGGISLADKASLLADGPAVDSTRGNIQLLPGDIANLLPFTGNLNPFYAYGPTYEQQERTITNDPLPQQQQADQAPAKLAIQPADPHHASDPLSPEEAQPLIQAVADKPAQQVQQSEPQAPQDQQAQQQPQAPQQIQPPQGAQIPPQQAAQPPVHQQDSPVVGQVADNAAQEGPPAAQPPIDLNNNQAPTTTATLPLPTSEPTVTMPSLTTAPFQTTRLSTLTRTVTATAMPTHNAAPMFSCPKALLAMTVVSLVAVAL